jgi:hypothetical protein
LHNGKVDFDLIKPACMHRTVRRHQTWIFLTEPRYACGCTVSRSIVHNPENSTRFLVWRTLHDLIDEPVEGSDSALSLTTAKQFRPMHVQRRQIGPRSTTLVFMFDFHGRTRSGWQRCVAAATRLNAGLLVGRQDEFIIFEAATVPDPFVKIENASRLFSKTRVSGEDPATMLPGSNCILVQPSPYRRTTDRCHASRLNDCGGKISPAPSGKGHGIGRWQFARKRLDLNYQVWGGKPGGGPGADAPQGRRGVSRKIFCAIAKPPLVGSRADERFRRYQGLLRLIEPFWRVAPENTVTYTSEPAPSVLAFRRLTKLSDMSCVSASQASSFANQDATTTILSQSEYVIVFTFTST